MSDILSALTTLYPSQVWLEVSQEQLDQAWLAEQKYSYDVARWTAFKNRLTLNAFLAWLKAESGVEEQPEVWPSRDDLSSIWEVVNGTAIQLGKTRIVLIPHEGMDTNEYEVQAEWVDIPTWAADYYLAVQVNSDDCWLRVWGYATHKKLKQAGQYNSISRTYSLGREELIEDLNVMWVARELGRDQRAVVKPLPTLSPAQAERLLEQLSQKSPYSPRLEVPFAVWGSLLASDEWRQALYDRRCMISAIAPSKEPVNLSRWLQNIFEAGWQTIEELLDWSEPALSFRSAEPVEFPALIMRGKLLDLGSQPGDTQVALLLGLMPKHQTDVDIWVKICPQDSHSYLPPGLDLAVLDETGVTVMQAQSRQTEMIQLRFSGLSGEQFSVQLTLGTTSVTETFMI